MSDVPYGKAVTGTMSLTIESEEGIASGRAQCNPYPNWTLLRAPIE